MNAVRPSSRTGQRSWVVLAVVLCLVAAGHLSTGPVTAAPAARTAAAEARAAATGPVQSVRLELLGRHDLASPGLDGQVKPRGQNGDVAVLGATAFVGGGALFHGAHASPGRICTDYGGVKVVDLSNPARPVLTTTITIEDTTGVGAPWPAGSPRRGRRFDNVSVSAGAVDARVLRTPTFTGDVLAIAVQRCEPSFFNGGRIEFWDVSDRARPSKLGVFDPTTIPNPVPGRSPANGQWGVFEDVRMFTRGDRVFAAVTTPFSIGNAHDASPFGDFRLLDITDVRNPRQVGTFPPVSIGESSVNGCKTFLAGRATAPTPDGRRAIVSFYDGSPLFGPGPAALFDLDLDHLPRYVTGSEPPRFDPSPPRFEYPPDPAVEGNAADVQTFTGPRGELLVAASEDDIDPALTNLSITDPPSAAGSFRVCENQVGAKLYDEPGLQLSGPVAYLGRGCPASTLPGGTNAAADEYLADPAGHIALLDAGPSPFDGCSLIEAANRAITAGATAVMSNLASETLSIPNYGPPGGLPSRPVVRVPQSAYSRMQHVPSPVLGGTTFPTTWARSTSTNVTVVAFPPGTRTDRSRFRSIANATDRVGRGEVRSADRFPVVAGQAYRAGAFLGVDTYVAGAFRSAVTWYDASGATLGESELAGLSAVTPRTRFDQTVVAPPGAARAAVKFEWVGAAAEGTGYADTFSFTPTAMRATLRDDRGEWGAQRIVDFSRNPPAEIGSYRSPTSREWPPPDNGIYAPRLARTFNDEVAFTTWLSDGLRVLDVSRPDAPREVASFVPPAAADPSPAAGAGAGLTRGQSWPDRPLVTGVDVIPRGDSCGLAVISDINAGLYVLGFEVLRAGRPPGCGGYWLAAADGGVFSFGDSDFFGSMGSVRLNRPVVGMAPTPTGRGYWLVASDGGIFSFGDARFFGSTGALTLNQPVVGMAATPSGRGYWLVASDGGIFAFGDAPFFGSTGNVRLNRPVVGMAPTPTGRGYWLVASDGGIFAFGDAPFFGSTGNIRLNQPVVGMAPTPTGRGYWLVASDGGIFAFGDAPFFGSTGNIRLNRPVVGMSPTREGRGYWLVASDGGIFAFGDAPFLGSTGAIRLNSPVVGMAAFPR